jgi:hypothetical protein
VLYLFRYNTFINSWSKARALLHLFMQHTASKASFIGSNSSLWLQYLLINNYWSQLSKAKPRSPGIILGFTKEFLDKQPLCEHGKPFARFRTPKGVLNRVLERDVTSEATWSTTESEQQRAMNGSLLRAFYVELSNAKQRETREAKATKQGLYEQFQYKSLKLFRSFQKLWLKLLFNNITSN